MVFDIANTESVEVSIGASHCCRGTGSSSARFTIDSGLCWVWRVVVAGVRSSPLPVYCGYAQLDDSAYFALAPLPAFSPRDTSDPRRYRSGNVASLIIRLAANRFFYWGRLPLRLVGNTIRLTSTIGSDGPGGTAFTTGPSAPGNFLRRTGLTVTPKRLNWLRDDYNLPARSPTFDAAHPHRALSTTW